jgi:hypothetical protein
MMSKSASASFADGIAMNARSRASCALAPALENPRNALAAEFAFWAETSTTAAQAADKPRTTAS